jgi:hypothetical protein
MQLPPPADRRVAVIRKAAILLIAAGALGLVLWLPTDRAVAVAGMIGSLAACAVPALLDGMVKREPRTQSRRVRRRLSRRAELNR